MDKKTFFYWLLLPVLPLLMAACSENNNEENGGKTTPNPNVPVSNDDWQTVPATGGSIVKGDIVLTFPSGTFGKDTKVAVTEVKKGTIGGKFEASPFYQVTMPATTAAQVKVKIKCAESADDIGFVLRTTARATSSLKEVQHDSYCETDHTGGEYTTTLPICDNGEDPGNVSFVIGLGHLPNADAIEAKAKTRALNWAISSGEYDGVKYKIYVGWGAWWAYDGTTISDLKTKFTPKLKECIEETIKQIHALGFRLKGSGRTIPFYYTTTEEWGEHEQDKINNNLWSCINLSVSKIQAASYVVTDELKQTMLHETFHYYQSDYDPRYFSFVKFLDDVRGNEEYVIMYEMGAVWIEKYRNNGLLNTEFQFENGIGSALDGKNNVLRLGASRDENDTKAMIVDEKSKGKEFQAQGYALAPMLYHLTSKYSCKDSDVVDLYSKHWKLKAGRSSVESLARWFESKNGFNFFVNDEQIDSYYLTLFKGEILKDFFMNYRMIIKDHAMIINDKPEKFTKEGKVFPAGCESMMVKISGFKDKDISDYEVVIKQECEDVHTYLLYAEQYGSLKQAPGKAIGNDSIVVAGSTFANMKNSKNEIEAYLVVLTTRTFNSEYNRGTIPTRTIIELRKRGEDKKELKVTPDSLLFEAEGGTQTVKVEAKGYKIYGGFSGTDCDDWITVDNEKLGTFTVTATPNNTTNEREGTIYAFGSTDGENPTKSNTDYLPIKVKQKASNHQISQVEISSIKIQTDINTNCTRHHYTHDGKIDKEEVFTHSVSDTQSFTQKYISCNISGSSLHVDIDYDYYDDHYDISFDVTGLSGDYKESRVTNLTYKRVKYPQYVFGHDELNCNVVFTNIPVSKIYKGNASDPLSLNTLIFDGKVAGGLGISGFSFEKYWTDGWGGYYSDTDTYIDDGGNHVTLTIDFESVK